MATLARLRARSSFIEKQYFYRNCVVDTFRKKEYHAAVAIQSWFRGCQVRAYIRYLHRVATIIQKWWRGYLGRKHYQLVVQVAYYTMKMDLYNAMAVRIQRRWRGFRIRKYCFNYFYLKEYLRAVSETNDAIREALEEFAEMKDREEKKASLEREERWRDRQARKMHYLLSTKQLPGIYNSPFRKEPDPWELRLRKAKPLIYQKPRVKQKYAASLTNWLACTSARSFPRSDSLPPINRKRCQGPFRDISEVLEQRYRPLEPTLRVAEPINQLKLAREELRREERMLNVNDQRFLPFSSYHKKEKYMPQIHSSSEYGPDSCGEQHFRSENPRKWICDKDHYESDTDLMAPNNNNMDKDPQINSTSVLLTHQNYSDVPEQDFQTVLPSFDLFSKYGKLYSKAGQIV